MTTRPGATPDDGAARAGVAGEDSRAARDGRTPSSGPVPEAPPDTSEIDADARALASVLRMRILRMCLDEPLTNKEIAERLGLPPGNTYHHVRMLARRGFLAAQPERTGSRGAREVPYLATGKSWRTPMGPHGSRILIETFLAEVALVDPAEVNTARLGLRVSPERKELLAKKLEDLFEEMAAWPADPDGEPLSLFLAIHEDKSRLRPPPPQPPPAR